MFENPRRGRQARNVTTNAPKILDLKSPSEQIFSRKLPLGAPDLFTIETRSCTLTTSGEEDKTSCYSKEKRKGIFTEGHPEKYHFLLLPPRSQLIQQPRRRIARFHSVLLHVR